VKGSGFEATVPGFWVAGALLAWAIRYRWVGGLVAGAILCATDILVREDIDQANYGNLFLLLIGGPVVGFMAASLQEMAAERDQAERAAAAASERARLARVVHDGVLQVLALVQRRGAELGGAASELGRLAGEQESALRTLIRSQDSVVGAPASTIDLAAELGVLESRPGVTVATPERPVTIEADRARELLAVVRACLDNVTAHVGDGAPVWVLLEDLQGEIGIDVRDEGPGVPDGRLGQAAAEGRLGVSESIRGRIEGLGGTATLTTSSAGTEWEFVVPR
jgi:signal transduction histidine kinase